MVSRPSGLPSNQGSFKDQHHANCFFIYINDLPNGLLSNPKLFPDDTSVFSVVKDHLNSSNKLNEVLPKIFQWDTSGRCHLKVH